MKLIQFNSEGGIQPGSTTVFFGAVRGVGFVNNSQETHSVVWDAGAPALLTGSPANAEDMAPGDGVTFDLTGIPRGTFTFTDGHNAQNRGQLVVS